METIGIIHIVLSLLAYILYFLITAKSFSGSINYKLLTISNVLYVVGFLLGIIWATTAWSNYNIFDLKIVLSFLVLIPFVVENIIKTGKNQFLILGCIIIILNYLIPFVLGTIHSH